MKFPAINCTEVVSLTLEKDGRTASRKDFTFDCPATMTVAGVREFHQLETVGSPK